MTFGNFTPRMAPKRSSFGDGEHRGDAKSSRWSAVWKKKLTIKKIV